VIGWGSLPGAIQQFHAPEFVQRDAKPVLRRPYRLPAGFTLSTILVAKHPILPFFVPSHPVRTKQTRAIVITAEIGRRVSTADRTIRYTPSC
jgi:hypothetical protein